MSLALLTNDDRELIAAFAACSLDMEPGSNWVQEVGGLPDFICQIARAILRGGKKTSVSRAIAIAVSRVKVWASGKGVKADTQAKAAKAVAEWEAKRAKSKAKTAAKKTGSAAKKGAKDTVKATAEPGGESLDLAVAGYRDPNILTLTDYNVDIVRQAFEDRTRAARAAWRKANPNAGYDDPGYPSYLYIKEQWTTFLIVQSDYGRNPELYKVPYSVDDKLNVTFGDPVEVKSQYVEISDADDAGSDISDEQLQQMMAACGPCPKAVTDKFLSLSKPTGLQNLVLLAGRRPTN